MDRQKQRDFLYLFERVGEPLYFSPRGRDKTLIIYNVPTTSITCEEIRDASVVTRRAFASTDGMRTVAVAAPSSSPDLSNVARMCPRSALYSYFNPNHRAAATELRQLFMRQKSLDQLLSMASVCRDSPMVNCKLWINSFASAMLFHPQTRNFQLPAAWEVMPDQFFSSFTMRQAFRQAELPERDRGVIRIDNPQTGRNTNPENRLAYFREDIGINSHHWHWHLIYRLEDEASPGRRKGELFYYMHHAMIARYDCERLANNLPRVRPLMIDDNPVMKEGYFPKLVDTNSGRNWGTRQNNTKLVGLNRADDPSLPVEYRTTTLEQLRKWRDRIMEAIDAGVIIGPGNRRIPLNIDALGDIVEASALSLNPQYYGREGFHNVGHMMIAHAHDPEYKHFENAGVMADTTSNMRDPIFHRWHKYVDVIFDTYKQTLQPYQDNGGEFPLSWSNVQVTNISVHSTAPGSKLNILRTYFMQSHADLSRGLDFLRTDENRLGSIWLKFTHLNHDPFKYTITVRNNASTLQRATVRIYIAPRLNEHQEQFVMAQQRKLFIEMDKFVHELRPGENIITRRSTDSSLTIPWEQTFRELERDSELPTQAQSICGCGWPQHMLIPRGTASGQIYDLVVFFTNAEEDAVPGAAPARDLQGGNTTCRESLSFCGRLGQPYPDSKPMGYPFDRNPFTMQDPSNPRGPQMPVQTLEQYVSRIPNMSAIQIHIVHDASRVVVREDGGPSGRREINGDPSVNSAQPMCPDQGQMPTRSGRNSYFGPSSTSASSTSPEGYPSESWPVWTSSSGTTSEQSRSNNPWYTYRERPSSRSRPSSPHSPQEWSKVSRPETPDWSWGD